MVGAIDLVNNMLLSASKAAIACQVSPQFFDDIIQRIYCINRKTVRTATKWLLSLHPYEDCPLMWLLSSGEYELGKHLFNGRNDNFIRMAFLGGFREHLEETVRNLENEIRSFPDRQRPKEKLERAISVIKREGPLRELVWSTKSLYWDYRVEQDFCVRMSRLTGTYS